MQNHSRPALLALVLTFGTSQIASSQIPNTTPAPGRQSSATATHFTVSSGSTATTGVPIQFTVTALDSNNATVTAYSDPVHFTSTDPSAALPADTTLTNGTGVFKASLVTVGLQTLIVSDPLSPSITGMRGNITVSAASGLRFVPVTPCRIVDTRNGTGGFTGPVATGATQNFNPTAGSCGIPGTAQAYSLNVAVVPVTTLGFLTAWPAGLTRPVAATLNSLDGRIKSNAAIVPAGTGGAISIFASDATQVILDINGYFVPNTTPGTLAFYPVTPCRLVDTRNGTLLSGPFAAGTSRTLPILSSPCNVPSTAQAYSLNFVAVASARVGFLTAYPTGATRPVAATLNDLTGTIAANAAIVPAGTAGSVDVFASDATQLVVDINGYFAPAGTGGLSLYTLTPCRVLDTRQPPGSPPFTGKLDVHVLGSACGGTPASQAYVLNATVVPPASFGFLTLWPQEIARPLVATLNALDGAITNNMAIVPTNNDDISAFASDNTHLILDMFGYFGPDVSSAPPTISDFNPKSGPAGTLVTLTGANLAPSPLITLSKQGGGTIPAPLAGATAGSLSFTIPSGTATGPIAVAVNGSIATSSVSLAIVASSGFSLTALPTAADLIQGQTVSMVVTLASASGFSQLAALGLSGLPSGVAYLFKPPSIAAGQSSLLTLTAPANQALGLGNLTVSASANVDGMTLSHATNISLNVVAPTTSLLARIAVEDSAETPLAGVTVTMLGQDGNGATTGCTGTAVSDGGGNVALRNLAANCAGPQLVRFNPDTVTSPVGKYAGVALSFVLTSGQVSTSPVVVHLPKIDSAETILVQQNAPSDQTFNLTSVPGMSITVYAGTTLTKPDTTQPNPFPLSVVQVPVDRLPDVKPPVPTMYVPQFVSFQPTSTHASKAVAVTYPNTQNMPPGTNVLLITLDPTMGKMVPYGSATVGNDGTQVVPDADPAFPGHRYGISNFDWHGANAVAGPNPVNTSTCTCPRPAQSRHPVDYSSGIETWSATDLAVSGPRGGISLERYYRTFTSNAGPFGVGTSLPRYSYKLMTLTPQTPAVINLGYPDGNQLPFVRQPDGTLINTTTPSLRGAVLSAPTATSAVLRWKDGTTFRFSTGPVVQFMVLTSIEDVNANVVNLNYSPTNGAQLTEIIDPVGRKIALAYDTNSRVTSAVDPIGRTVAYVYDGNGHLSTITNPEGGVTTHQYDTSGRMTRIIDPRGVTRVVNTYDANGRVIDQLTPDGGHLQIAYTLLNPTAPLISPVIQTDVTDQRGNKTTYRYNAQGYILTVTDANGQNRNFEYEPGTNFLKAMRGNGICDVCGATATGDVSFTYDANGNLLTQTDALGNTTFFTYEPVYNKVASVTNALNQTTQFNYDDAGNLIRVTDPRGNGTRFAYGNFGLLASVTDAANQSTSLTYDNVGNLQAVTDPLANRSGFTYDAVSRLIESRNPAGGKSQIRYDKMNRVLRQTDPQGRMVQFTYDLIGDVLTVTDPRGKVTSYQYDSMARPTRRTDPLARFETYGYDLAGNLTQFVDRRGLTSAFAYDLLNRLITETYVDAAVQRVYDGNGRLVRVDDSQGGSFSYLYDLAGRLIRSVAPQGTIDYSRDALGRITSRQVVGQPRLDFTFDSAGNLTRSALPQASIDFVYDARRLLTGMSRSNSVTSVATYDALGRLLTLNHANGGTVLNTQSYSYDQRGFRSSTANDISQPLITAATTGAYDDANQMGAFGGRTFTQDANGNRLTETGPGGLTTYSWDGRNRLGSITRPAGVQSFRYDFAGNMIRQDVPSGGTNYVLDNTTNVVYQSSDAGTSLSFLTAGLVDTHLASVDASGRPSFALMGALGTVLANSGPSGNVDGRALYEPYGQTTTSGVPYPFEYAARPRVAPNLYYDRARFYDSIGGRFLSEDLYEQDTPNRYSYVKNRPTEMVDASGRQAEAAYEVITTGAEVSGGGGLVSQATNLQEALSHNPAEAYLDFKPTADPNAGVKMDARAKQIVEKQQDAINNFVSSAANATVASTEPAPVNGLLDWFEVGKIAVVSVYEGGKKFTEDVADWIHSIVYSGLPNDNSRDCQDQTGNHLEYRLSK